MMYPAFLAIILPIVVEWCGFQSPQSTPADPRDHWATLGSIPPPPGFHRPALHPGSFGHWLRDIPLSPDPVVHLFNGKPKSNQDVHVAVLEMPVGKKDLQQCADACMRLRAEYLRDGNRMREIGFRDNAGRWYKPGINASRQDFERYLEQVFAWCGTASLEKQLQRLSPNTMVLPGDVIIQGGSPGHAVIVMDMVENAKGERRYLLAQSYMPAQQMHVLKNPLDPAEGPWYNLVPGKPVVTPEWVFQAGRIGRW